MSNFVEQVRKTLRDDMAKVRQDLMGFTFSNRYQGSWQAQKYYQAGDLVYWHKTIYYRISNGKSGSTFSITNWQAISAQSIATPASGKVLLPNYVTTTSTANHTSGTVYAVPMDLSAAGLSCSGLTVSLNVAQIGGTTTFQIAPWADDGTGEAPDWARGPLVAPATIDLTGATGSRNTSQAFNAWAGTPSIWLLAFYLETVAPSTKAKLVTINGALSGKIATNASWTANFLYRQVSAQSSYPVAGAAPGTLAASGGTGCPVMGLVAA